MSCPDCFRGGVHAHSEPTGTIETVHGMRTYIAGGSDSARSKSTILYLPDAFSLKLVNNKILADQYASATGCRVLIPDVVPNGGLSPDLMPSMEIAMAPLEKRTVGGVLHKIWITLTLLPHVVPFILFGRPHKVYSQILAYARAIKAELPLGGKLGVAGFCWGAWPSTKLCTEPATEGGSERLIDAQFNGHPSFISDTPEMVVDAIKKFKVPYACAVAEIDMQFNAEVAAKTEALVKQETAGASPGEYIYDFRIYKGCQHGFCVRAMKEDEANFQGGRDAAKHAIDWFNKYLN
ncbi:hypothetical protein A1O1_07999 [Capronia coronata CBS 617.96]|uniref:Dienelactone hydrolase domain-containing protein n=1 Tax=Capronia coronata CBS 617.96 TaxID=1182541 RepID=W9XN26_9EURO|nr:uncharacterized protein A1O1_07999 [Capronia coronata CBS 617.96]EXJ81932.1 hypothetical protein A1O1_07999 [Capronia coronata CBS 617.96]